jgi:hypothetical protein
MRSHVLFENTDIFITLIASLFPFTAASHSHNLGVTCHSFNFVYIQSEPRINHKKKTILTGQKVVVVVFTHDGLLAFRQKPIPLSVL